MQDPRNLPEGAGATTNRTNGDIGTTTSFIGSGATERGETRSSGARTDLPGAPSQTIRDETSLRDDTHRALTVRDRSNRPSMATVAGAAVAGAIAGGALPFLLAGRGRGETETETIERSVIINRPARELYEYWRDFTHFPQFMDNVKSVRKIDERRSHWVIKGPAGTSVEFESRIVDDLPGRRIAWESDHEARVPNRGRVEFIETPTGQGTNVRLTLSYEPPAGKAGRIAAKVLRREPGTQAREDLGRFKELMENRR